MNDENRKLNDKFMLRLPDGLRDRIAAAAKHNGRSMNAEIVQILEAVYPPAPSFQDMAIQLDAFLTWTEGLEFKGGFDRNKVLKSLFELEASVKKEADKEEAKKLK
jgi:plasmid stability protein